MAVGANITGDLVCTGNISGKTMTIPAASVGNSAMNSGSPADCDKVRHRYRGISAQLAGTTAVTRSQLIHSVNGATATIKSLKVGSDTANVGGATITIDLKKNGSGGASVLSAAIVLNNTHTANVSVDAVIASAALVAGDKLYLVVTVAAGGGTIGKGDYGVVEVDEDAA